MGAYSKALKLYNINTNICSFYLKKETEKKMPGTHIVGVFADFNREDEGEYICPRCTVFGLEKEEVETLIGDGFLMTDHNKVEEGYEVQSSVFKLMRALGKKFGFELHGNPLCTSAPNDRKTLVYTLKKDV